MNKPGYSNKRRFIIGEECTRVTKWLHKNNEKFCFSIKELIKKNHNDDSWIETDGAGRIALFRTITGLPFIKYTV